MLDLGCLSNFYPGTLRYLVCGINLLMSLKYSAHLDFIHTNTIKGGLLFISSKLLAKKRQEAQVYFQVHNQRQPVDSDSCPHLIYLSPIQTPSSEILPMKQPVSCFILVFIRKVYRIPISCPCSNLQSL